MTDTREKFMALALAEAKKAWGRTSPNPMVGAVVVRGNKVISKGYHHRAGEAHAEVNALAAAGDQAQGADIYVTLEPCNHQGRTPPCTRAVLEAGIQRVVIGQMDPNPHVEGGGAAFLKSRGLTVETGVLADRCAELNLAFTKYITTGLPLVLVKSAATLDGKLATASGHSRWVTGEKARRYVHRLRDYVDAILVGRGTVEADDPTLNTRLKGRRKTKDPVRIVLDSKLHCAPSARVFDPALGGRTIAACGPRPAVKRVRALEKRGVEIWSLPLVKGRVGFRPLLERLGREKITSLLVEGGAGVNWSVIVEEKAADRLYFFYAPKIVGGLDAPTLTGGPGVRTMDDCIRLDIHRTRRFGPDLLIEAIPRYGQ